MKQNNIFLGMAGMIATMAMFTACSQNEAEDIAPISKNNVISLTSSMETMRGVSDPQTNALSANNTVGVFVTSGETTITNGDNNKHTVGNGGALSTTTPMYYPAEDGAKVNIYAYAPYKSGIALATASNFSVATDQSAEAGYLSSDLVCASKENQASSESAVSLTFGHKMSQLQITINNQASLDLSEAAVYITGTKIATTFNPSTGAIGDASGDATDIKSVAALGTNTKAYTIVVPQTIAANTALVKITTSEKTYIAKLTAAATLASGKAYKFSVTLTSSTEPVVEVPISLSATSLTEWGEPTDLGTANMEEVISYEIGDFILADGTLVKNANLTDAQKNNVVAVIFSTEVSETDKDAGYVGYAMGVKRIGASGGTKKQWYVQTAYNLGASTLVDAMKDLDGLSKAQTIRKNEIYTNLEDKTNHVANLTDYSVTKTGTNLSEWFTPSYGQLILMLNNLGNAGITTSTITAGTDIGNYNPFYVSTDDTSAKNISDVFAAINVFTKKAGKGDILTVGNIDLGTITENTTSTSAGQKVFQFEVKSSGQWNLTAAQAKVPTAGVKEVCVIPVLAYKLPTE
ncbi:MAG: fimbrillin family protein [Prevotella sp.]|nr:fimbrillin family protein [Prevotella sp.]